jgi:hypothetical protein
VEGEGVRALEQQLRPPDVAVSPAVMGAARANRHSFARSLIRAAARGRWRVERERFDIDADGRGEAVYRVDLEGGRSDHRDRAGVGDDLRLVVFSQVLDESERTDRVIARDWDVTAALCRGVLDAERLSRLRANVTAQEDGRADGETLIWGRANRSARYFDAVVESLAAGRQPDPGRVGDDAYLLRSTAFYGNGKFGLLDFDGDRGDGHRHPLGVPYRAQMLTAWLVREFSLDLVEHCARRRSARAVALNAEWRRFFGLGNATGLGLVPYAFRHPAVFDRWVTIRELARANAVAADVAATAAGARRIDVLLCRAITHFEQRPGLSTAPYPSGPDIATGLRALRSDRSVGARWPDGEAPSPEPTGGSSSDNREPAPGPGNATAGLLARAEALHAEIGAVVESIVVELDDSLDTALEELLVVDEVVSSPLPGDCGRLLAVMTDEYDWLDGFDLDSDDATHHFWYVSADSQEPRRGRRGVDRGQETEVMVGVAPMMAALARSLRTVPADEPAWKFAIEHPRHTAALDRLSTVVGLRYGEPRVNACDRRFLPLDLQRLQLAVYGMENFSPQSTDWLRVTLFSGAPRADELAAGLDDDWMFAVKPDHPEDSNEDT